MPFSLTVLACAGQGTMGERIKESIPGTREYEGTHGMTEGQRGAEQLKSYIPGKGHMRYESVSPSGADMTEAEQECLIG
jgi:hypothetical protein